MQRELHGTDSGFAEGADGTRIYWSAVGSGEPALVCCASTMTGDGWLGVIGWKSVGP